ncbi:uncharacterized protein LOC144445719 [Glandiceps talaboti]
MLGDVRVRTKPALGRERRRRSIPDIDHKIIEPLTNNDITHRNNYSKFLSLHRSSHRRPKINTLSQQGASLLDIDYSRQAQCVLSHIGNWDWDVFYLNQLTNGRSLFYVSLYLFHEYNLIEYFQLDMIRLMKCLALIEEGYHCKNPYHNAIHAADVTQAMHCYLQEHLLAGLVTPLEVMAALLASVTHDLDHPGVNQAFLIATSNHLASLYHNSSVLENHHWRSAIAVLSETGLVDHFKREDKLQLEWYIKSFILSTDITRQQEFLTRFERHLERRDLDLTSSEHRHFILQIALKCADICNPCRVWNTSKKWSQRVCEEFFQQGDYERRLNLPITSNCDRYKTTVANIQAGFIEYVVEPLFLAWQRLIPSQLNRLMRNNLLTNKTSWQQILRDAKHEKQQKSLQNDGFQATVVDGSTLGTAEVEMDSMDLLPPSTSNTKLPPLEGKVTMVTVPRISENTTKGGNTRTEAGQSETGDKKFRSNGSAQRDVKYVTTATRSTHGKSEVKVSVKPKDKSIRTSTEPRVRTERTIHIAPGRVKPSKIETEGSGKTMDSSVHQIERKSKTSETRVNLEQRTIQSQLTLEPSEKSERLIEMKLTVEPSWETLSDNQPVRSSSEGQRSQERTEKVVQSKVTYDRRNPEQKTVEMKLTLDPEDKGYTERTVESRVTIDPMARSEKAEVSLSMSPSVHRRSQHTSTTTTTRHTYSGDAKLRSYSSSPSRSPSRSSRSSRGDIASPTTTTTTADVSQSQRSPRRYHEVKTSAFTARGATSPSTQSKFSRSSSPSTQSKFSRSSTPTRTSSSSSSPSMQYGRTRDQTKGAGYGGTTHRTARTPLPKPKDSK